MQSHNFESPQKTLRPRLFPALKSILQSKWFTFAAVVIIGFFLLLIIKLQPSLKTVGQEINNLNQKIAETEKSRSELEKLKDFAKSADYMERQARLKLNYKRPDENAFFVYRNQYNQAQASPSPPFQASPGLLANWQKWLKYLFGE